jgi:hypothetical protein
MGSDRLFSDVDKFAAALRKLRKQRYKKRRSQKKFGPEESVKQG